MMQSKNFFHKLYYEWWKNIDKFIFSLILLLFITGLFFSLVSTSLIASDRLNTNDYLFFFKHLLIVLLGMVIIFSLSSLDEKKLFRISPIIFLFSIFFMVLVPFIGIEVKGSKRWIDLFFLPRFQPIELVKPFLIIVISLILSSRKYNNILIKYFFSFLTALIVAFLLAIQPDIGQTILIFLSWAILIFTSGLTLAAAR